MTIGIQERVIHFLTLNRVCFHAGERGTVGRSEEKVYRCNITGRRDDRPPLGVSGLPQNGEQRPEEEEERPSGEKLPCAPIPEPQPGKT